MLQKKYNSLTNTMEGNPKLKLVNGKHNFWNRKEKSLVDKLDNEGYDILKEPLVDNLYSKKHNILKAYGITAVTATSVALAATAVSPVLGAVAAGVGIYGALHHFTGAYYENLRKQVGGKLKEMGKELTQRELNNEFFDSSKKNNNLEKDLQEESSEDRIKRLRKSYGLVETEKDSFWKKAKNYFFRK